MKKYFLYEIKKSLPAAGYLTLSMTAWYLILILLFSITRLEDIFYNLVPLMFFVSHKNFHVQNQKAERGFILFPPLIPQKNING